MQRQFEPPNPKSSQRLAYSLAGCLPCFELGGSRAVRLLPKRLLVRTISCGQLTLKLLSVLKGLPQIYGPQKNHDSLTTHKFSRKFKLKVRTEDLKLSEGKTSGQI